MTKDNLDAIRELGSGVYQVNQQDLLDTIADLERQRDTAHAAAIQAAAHRCHEHAEELIAMIGKNSGPHYGKQDEEQRDAQVKDQAYTARICAQRVKGLTPANAQRLYAFRIAEAVRDKL